MHIIGWEGKQKPLLDAFASKETRLTSVNGGILYEANGNWSDLFLNLANAHQQAHEKVAIQNYRKGKEEDESIVKTTITISTRATIVNVQELIDSQKSSKNNYFLCTNNDSLPTTIGNKGEADSMKNEPPKQSEGGGSPLLAAIRNKGGSNGLQSSNKSQEGGSPLLAAIRNKGGAGRQKKTSTSTPNMIRAGGNPLLAAIRNKGGSNSLKKSSPPQPKSSAEGGSPLLAAIRNKGGATGLKQEQAV